MGNRLQKTLKNAIVFYSVADKYFRLAEEICYFAAKSKFATVTGQKL